MRSVLCARSFRVSLPIWRKNWKNLRHSHIWMSPSESWSSSFRCLSSTWQRKSARVLNTGPSWTIFLISSTISRNGSQHSHIGRCIQIFLKTICMKLVRRSSILWTGLTNVPLFPRALAPSFGRLTTWMCWLSGVSFPQLKIATIRCSLQSCSNTRLRTVVSSLIPSSTPLNWV